MGLIRASLLLAQSLQPELPSRSQGSPKLMRQLCRNCRGLSAGQSCSPLLSPSTRAFRVYCGGHRRGALSLSVCYLHLPAEPSPRLGNNPRHPQEASSATLVHDYFTFLSPQISCARYNLHPLPSPSWWAHYLVSHKEIRNSQMEMLYFSCQVHRPPYLCLLPLPVSFCYQGEHGPQLTQGQAPRWIPDAVPCLSLEPTFSFISTLPPTPSPWFPTVFKQTLLLLY